MFYEQSIVCFSVFMRLIADFFRVTVHRVVSEHVAVSSIRVRVDNTRALILVVALICM